MIGKGCTIAFCSRFTATRRLRLTARPVHARTIAAVASTMLPCALVVERLLKTSDDAHLIVYRKRNDLPIHRAGPYGQGFKTLRMRMLCRRASRTQRIQNRIKNEPIVPRILLATNQWASNRDA